MLGVPPGAGPEQVRAAFRERVRQLHPDSRDPDIPAARADGALGLVQSAWEVLGNEARRAAYDRDRATRVATPVAPVAARPRPGPAGGPGPSRVAWWVLVLVVLSVIFVVTAYAGAPPGQG